MAADEQRRDVPSEVMRCSAVSREWSGIGHWLLDYEYSLPVCTPAGSPDGGWLTGAWPLVARPPVNQLPAGFSVPLPARWLPVADDPPAYSIKGLCAHWLLAGFLAPLLALAGRQLLALYPHIPLEDCVRSFVSVGMGQ
ncbi:hypothetical protein NDU88_004873 [Pleurodeles waltl]|uniref:Uncharacterized protein n=1 Tax=Pleurodeles waltl TaxID=8319 RepID=A0AAV7WT83_PLEWA|nr:hypothetical protein NDU88_004873 [Pleurodeles waltl]